MIGGVAAAVRLRAGKINGRHTGDAAIQYRLVSDSGTARRLGMVIWRFYFSGRRLAMMKVGLVISLLAFLGTPIQGQQKVPPLLLRAAHCLEVNGFLPPPNEGKLTFGYLLDEHSYPGDKVVYVVAYATATRSNGRVFEVFLTADGRREVFNIQNNARFVLSKHEPGGVSFVSPPLGGTWTREHLASAIRRVEKRPRFSILLKDLKADDSCRCDSYADPQPKGN